MFVETIEVVEMTKRKTTEAVATESAAQAVLRKSGVRDLSPSEEKVMRMRLGASVPRKEHLERVGRGDADLEIELLAFEIEAFLKLRERRALRQAPAPTTSRAKEKIIRALRKKGPTR